MHALRAQVRSDVHGYMLPGWWDAVGNDLERAVEQALDVHLDGNPDVVRVVNDGVGIDEARLVRMLQSRKGVGKKIFFLAFRSMTVEAQNALLKIFEEPTRDTYFFVVVPSAVSLIPTLRSRLRLLTHENTQQQNDLVERFLAAPPAKRLTVVGDILEAKDKQAAHLFLDDLLSTLYYKSDEQKYRALEQTLFARKYMPDRGASLKLLLEHIALVV